MFTQQLHIGTGLAVKTLCPRFRDNGDKVAVARFVFAQQHKMPVFVIDAVNFIEPAALCNVDLAADDRLDAALFRCFIKVDHAVHHAVIRNGNAFLTHFLRLIEQLFNAASAVQKAVFGVHMQMCKRHFRPPFPFKFT